MQDRSRQAAENSARYTRLAEHVAQLSITEVSHDSTVEVTVSANGLLTGLVLHPSTVSLPVVAEEIMDCVRRAQARIPELLRHTMSDIVGDGDPSTRLLLDEAARRFPPPPPRETPGTQWEPEELRIEPEHREPERAVRRPRPSQPHDEDDWDDRPIMRDF